MHTCSIFRHIYITFCGITISFVSIFKILESLIIKGKLEHLRALDINHTVGLTEPKIFEFIKKYGHNLEGLAIAGKPKLAEQFFLNVIPFMKEMK